MVARPSQFKLLGTITPYPAAGEQLDGIGTTQGRGQPSLAATVKRLIASSVVTVIGFSAICISVMLDMRRGEVDLARQSLENLAAGIDADINRNIEIYDLSLRGAASNMVAVNRRGVPTPIGTLTC